MGLIVAGAAFYSPAMVPDGAIRIGPLNASYYLLVACGNSGPDRHAGRPLVVPMNALLQHRGHVLLSAGHSIAVQNFNENLSILVMLALYATLVWFDLRLQTVMLLFGMFVAGSMLLVIFRHQFNQRQFDSVALIGEVTH